MNTKLSCLSVLMSTYNRGHLIASAIQSIVDQTYEDWELIIIDDGSTDNTIDVIRKYEDKRIKYYYFPHKGLSHALFVGNELCTGKIIVKQDSDDLSLPNRLEVITDFFKKNKPEFVYHGMYQTWEDEESTGIMHRQYIPALPINKRILKEQYIPGAFAYTKQFSKEVPYRHTHCSDDWMLILDAYLKKKNIGYINQGLYEYILREDSNSMIHENTGHYEQDEEKMKIILETEYGIKNFKYAKR